MPPTLKFTTASRVLHAQCQGRPRSGRAAARPGRTRRGGYRQIHGMVHAPTDYFTFIRGTTDLSPSTLSSRLTLRKSPCVAGQPPLSGFSLQEPLHHSSLACGEVALHVRPALGAASGSSEVSTVRARGRARIFEILKSRKMVSVSRYDYREAGWEARRRVGYTGKDE